DARDGGVATARGYPVVRYSRRLRHRPSMVGTPTPRLRAGGRDPKRGVLIVTAHFPPSRTAGTHRLLRFANDLNELGWDVSVLTLSPDAYRPGVAVDEELNRHVAPDIHVTRTRVPGRKRPEARGPANRP